MVELLGQCIYYLFSGASHFYSCKTLFYVCTFMWSQSQITTTWKGWKAQNLRISFFHSFFLKAQPFVDIYKSLVCAKGISVSWVQLDLLIIHMMIITQCDFKDRILREVTEIKWTHRNVPDLIWLVFWWEKKCGIVTGNQVRIQKGNSNTEAWDEAKPAGILISGSL